MTNKYTDAILAVEHLSVSALEYALQLDFQLIIKTKFFTEYFTNNKLSFNYGATENFYCLLAAFSDKDIEEFKSLYL